MQIKEMLKKNDNMRSVPWSAIIDIANQSADPEVARDLENGTNLPLFSFFFPFTFVSFSSSLSLSLLCFQYFANFIRKQ